MAYLKPFNVDGSFIEAYTPVVGRITTTKVSPQGVAQFLEGAKFIITADANVTFRDYAGNAVVAMPWKAGVIFPCTVTEISVLSTGSLYIIHDGVLSFAQNN